MPIYDYIVLFRRLDKAVLKASLKRNLTRVLEEGVVIRKLENLGYRELPFSITKKGNKEHHAHYFLLELDASQDTAILLEDKLLFDGDVLRAKPILKARDPLELCRERKIEPCTMHEDLLPPPLRKSVIDLQELGKKRSSGTYFKRSFKDKEEYNIL